MSLFVHDDVSWCVVFRVREALPYEGTKKATALGGFVVEYRR